MHRIWSDTERRFIRENVEKMTDKKLSEKLSQITGRHISLQALRKQRQKMGISKYGGRGVNRVKKFT